MTIEQLIAEMLAAFVDTEFVHEHFVATYGKYLRPVGSGVFSVALNDETRDIRFVYMGYPVDGWKQGYEVIPRTVIRTEYERV